MNSYVVHKGVHCQVFDHGWRVKQWKSDVTGQQELMFWKRRIYVPLDDWDNPEIHQVNTVDQSGTLQGELEAAERRERALKKSAARAKRTCRMKIKAAGVGSLLTCTYRENMEDFDRMRRDWAAMLRKLRKAIPGFRAIYSFETQERGCWHVHAAVDKLPRHFDLPEGRVRSWDYLRRCWRAIVGADNGNIDLDGHLKTRHGLPGKYRSGHSLSKLAGYVSKYLTKDYADGIEGRNRWGSTQGIELSKPVVFDMPEMPLHDLINLTFHLPEGHRIASHTLFHEGRFWMLYTEPSPDPLH